MHGGRGRFVLVHCQHSLPLSSGSTSSKGRGTKPKSRELVKMYAKENQKRTKRIARTPEEEPLRGAADEDGDPEKANGGPSSSPLSKTEQWETDKGEKPVDKYSLVKLIMLLHGVGMLIPWSSFLTIALAYFVCYKLRDISDFGNRETTYSRDFFNYLTAFAQAPNLALNCFNLFFTFKGGLTPRILVSIGVVSLICAFTITLIFIDTFSWITGFFWLTMIMVVVLNGANGVYQNSMFGITADLPPEMIAAVVTGNNLCAVITAVLGIGAVAAATSAQASAAFFFGCSLLIVIVCGLSFTLLRKLPFYTYYVKEDTQSTSKRAVVEGPKETITMKLRTYIDVFKTAWIQYLNIWLVFFVCLALYPSIQVQFRSHSDFFIGPKFFALITTFLNFGVSAFLGSLLSNYVQWPSPPYLIVLTAGRLLLIPFFLACNIYPATRRWGVLVFNEWAFIIAGAIMGFTTGYGSALAMMYAPGSVEPKKARSAGMLASFVLVVGLCSGIGFTFFERWFMENVGPLAPQPLDASAHVDVCLLL